MENFIFCTVILAYSGIIQAYSGIFKTMCNPGILRTVVYPEPWHIQNQKHIQNLDIFANLVYLEPQYIQNAVYSESKAWTLQTSTMKGFAEIVNLYN